MPDRRLWIAGIGFLAALALLLAGYQSASRDPAGVTDEAEPVSIASLPSTWPNRTS